ncbi:MAG: PQQ-binding-like beta-propeller repeat protein [Haloarculaceae archaeon]
MPESPGTSTPGGALSWAVGLESAVSTRPVVGGGAVYAGTESGTVTRRASGDGAQVWTYDAGEPIRDLALEGGRVLAVSGTTELAAGHTLLALDASSGERTWEFSPTGWWLELVAAHAGQVYVATADDVLGDESETLYAIPVRTGEPAWSVESIGTAREGVIGDDALYLSTWERLHAFATADGTERWAVRTPDPVGTTLGLADGTVVQGHEPDDGGAFGVLAGFDAATGDRRWLFDDWSVTSVGTREGDLYAGGAAVAALDPADGTVRWESDAGGFVTGAGVGGERVYAGSETLGAFDRESGERAWTWSPDPPQGGVQAAGVRDGTVYLDAYRDADPRNRYKFGVDADSGDGLWSFEDATDLTDLVLGDDLAVAGGRTGRLYALA